ncbi:MAG: phosphatase PAP2 family protein [Promethearchaeota archaeon]
MENKIINNNLKTVEEGGDILSYQLNWRDLLWVSLIAAVLFGIGVIFVPTKWNTGLYSENTLLHSIAYGVTQLGNEYFFIFIFVIIFFTLNKNLGIKLFMIFTIMLLFTAFFKDLFQDPRPVMNTLETSYGFPSGHTTSTVALWGYLFFIVKNYTKTQFQIKTKKTVQIISLILLLIIPLSRLILGAHDLEDVVGGYLIGGAILMLFLLLEPKYTELNWNYKKKLIINLSVFLGLYIVLSALLGIIHPDKITDQLEHMAQGGGILIGISVAIPLEEYFIKYNPRALSRKHRIISGVICLILAGGIYFGLSLAFKALPVQYIFRFIRYMLVAGMITLGLPWFMMKIFHTDKNNE